MTTQEALVRARVVLATAKVADPPPIRNFLDYGAVVIDAAKSLTFAQRHAFSFGFKDWAEKWREMYEDYDRLVLMDPMVLYEPANAASLAFHSSPAFIRYFRAGNRTSKTQSGYAEHYMVATGQHRWRKFGQPPNASFIVAGLPFSTYQAGVFEAKFVSGEQENPLSPMFPVGGKWFYHYDERQRILTVACPSCAEELKGAQCRHPKSTIRLFSCENGYEVLQGAAYTLGHFDEDTPEEFFNEGRQRVKTSRYGGLIMTGTPLHGDQAWEQKIVARIFKSGPPENLTDPEDQKSQPLVSLHQISMWDAGLVPHAQIKMEAALMDEFERRARIDGEPLPLAKNPVFDRRALQEIKAKYVRPPQRGMVRPTDRSKPLLEIDEKSSFEFSTDLAGPLRVWKHPEPGEVYVACVDTAAGLADGDASCCSVLRVYTDNLGVSLELVAQYHGWITPQDYADALLSLCYWYNAALMVIELTGGLGRAVMLRARENGYWNLYREKTDVASIEPQLQTRMGVETNVSTKPFMVAALQQFIKERRIAIPCDATIHELTAFEQHKVGAGGAVLANPKYAGSMGTHDDRVISLCIGAATVISYPQLLYAVQYASETKHIEQAQAKVSKDMNAFYDNADRQESAL